MVFELNEVDYATLSNPDIWDSTVQVAEFAGTRWWRKNNAKFTPRQKISQLETHGIDYIQCAEYVFCIPYCIYQLLK